VTWTAPLSKRVDDENVRNPIDGYDACDLFSSGVPPKIHLPIPMAVDERPFGYRTLLDAQFDLAARHSSFICPLLSVWDQNYLSSVYRKHTDDFECIRSR